MIKNERQYKITKSEAAKFKQTLGEIVKNPKLQEELHPLLAMAEQEAMQSQLDDLLEELKEYEDLKSGKISELELDSLDELPNGLIRARIASGLSQKELADRLGIKEQQVQRYESEGYMSASLQRLSDISKALGIKVTEKIDLANNHCTLESLFNRIETTGVERDFLLSNVIPSQISAQIEANDYEADEQSLIRKVIDPITRVFGWDTEELLSGGILEAPTIASAAARFKIPANRSANKIGIYATYAHYLSLIVIVATVDLPQKNVPLEKDKIRDDIMERYGKLTLESATNYCWDLGVPVLPLRGRGTFHGACWRHFGRNVIILKQISKFESRWLFDLIHELYHAGQNPDLDEFEVIETEETSEDRRNSPEEIAASQFAGDVVLNGRAEELAQLCVKRTRGNLQFLKNALQEIAVQEKVSVGLLANYLAFRLSWQGESWWGAATNLQEKGNDPWTIVRDVFLERFSFKDVSPSDLQLIKQSLR